MNAVTLDQLAQSIDPAGLPREVVAGAVPALRVLAVAGVRKGIAEGRSPDGTPYRPLARPRPDGSATPLRDKGLLAASVTATASETSLTLQISHPGANVHQYGATIRPKAAGALALPLTPEAKRVGSPRKNHFPRPLFVYRPKDSESAFLAEGGTTPLVLHYALRKRVVVPARPYLGISAETAGRMAAVLQTRSLEWIARKFLAETGPLVESWGLSV